MGSARTDDDSDLKGTSSVADAAEGSELASDSIGNAPGGDGADLALDDRSSSITLEQDGPSTTLELEIKALLKRIDQARTSKGDGQPTVENLQNLRPVLQQLLLSRRESFQGPLPHPRHFKAYEETCPGAADRILVMAEKQAAHRQELVRHALEIDQEDTRAGRRETRLGQILGCVVCCAALGTAALIAILTQSAVGTVMGSLLGGGSLVGLVLAFTRGAKGDDAASSNSPKLLPSGGEDDEDDETQTN